ncbi:MAG: hypothetical protein E7C49_11605 [Clostridium sp.]|nr:hypothetical protein [Clostridium sp.]
MGIQIKGLNSLLKKLDNVSNIKTKEIMEEVAEGATKAIQEEAKKFSDTSYLYAGEVEVRDYGISCFIDVGFSSEKTPFELWKPLWFQHWGFRDYGLNFQGDYYIANNKMWFESAIKNYEAQAKREIKEKLRAEVRKVLA